MNAKVCMVAARNWAETPQRFLDQDKYHADRTLLDSSLVVEAANNRYLPTDRDRRFCPWGLVEPLAKCCDLIISMVHTISETSRSPQTNLFRHPDSSTSKPCGEQQIFCAMCPPSDENDFHGSSKLSSLARMSVKQFAKCQPNTELKRCKEQPSANGPMASFI